YMESLEDRILLSPVPLGLQFRVNSSTAGVQTTDSAAPNEFRDQAQSVAMNEFGNFVVTWSSTDSSGTNQGIFAQLFTASGVRQGGEIQANTPDGGTDAVAPVPMVLSGDFVMAWAPHPGGGALAKILARRY